MNSFRQINKCMKYKYFLSGLFILFSSVVAFSQSKVTLHADEGKTTINKNIYGHFAEHLGHCIYDGFYVGEKSTIPNTNGVRNDIIEALKKLKVANLRWP